MEAGEEFISLLPAAAWDTSTITRSPLVTATRWSSVRVEAVLVQVIAPLLAARVISFQPPWFGVAVVGVLAEHTRAPEVVMAAHAG